ncbi:MAG: phage tail sheath subtilisin-like domain-containing protein [Oscillospiraceae bacterium]|nr:phage tail sheath subtilisin-like domain-containing protein [Oscillospiraceae bacterium]
MAKLTSPLVSVTFTELGISAITRGDKGTVALIIRDEADVAPLALTQASQTPDTLGKENQDYIKRTFLGYVTPPKKVIVYVMGADGSLADALDYMAAQVFDYICGPADCTKEEAADIASWVKSQRLNNGAKFKAVLPNHPADNYAIVNFAGSAMTDGTTVWSTAEYCSRIAGLLAGTPMKISATYAPLPELSDCARLTKEASDEAVGSGELALKWDGRKVKLNRAVTSLVTTSEGMLDSFKKIKIVEIMDLIRTDITATAEDEYVGKYANSYDNKMLLVTAIRGYLMGLEQGGLVQPGYTVDIDVDAIEQYLVSRGTNTDEMTTRELREADTGSHVFILVRCKILDAIEDILINVEI